MATASPLALPEHRSLFASFGAGLADAVDPPDVEVPADWESWLDDRLGDFIRGPYAAFHREFWDWVWGLRAGVAAPAFIAIWFRGGGKSSSIESAVVVVACERRRQYALYVCETQQQADDHVQSIAGLLESPQIERLYPDVARKKVGKYGNAAGWRRNRLTTASGFILDAMGLDVAGRGRKMGKERPDLIILDDLDNPHDTEATVARKITTLTKTVLPMRATHATAVGVQNLIHTNGIFARLLDGRADFLADRTVSGPHPAVVDLAYERRGDRWVITGGTATWEQQDLATLEAELNDIGPTAFRAEKQHEPAEYEDGMFAGLTFRRCARADVPELVRTVVWCDPAVTSRTEAEARRDGGRVSDSNAIVVSALGVDGRVYDLAAWEAVAGPDETITRAIAWALRFGALKVGIETDQGGDLWEREYKRTAVAYAEEHGVPLRRMPGFASAKAGSHQLSKQARAQLMLLDYEQDQVVHVTHGPGDALPAPHVLIERALARYLRDKPFDLVDAKYWAWHDLRSGGLMARAMDRGVLVQGRASKGWQRR